jgi:hypothetical protein
MVLDGRARPELVDTYQSDRLPVIRQLVRMTERATRAFNSTNPLVHAAITRLAPIVLARSRVQENAVPRLGQLAAGYRDCPIAKGGGRSGRCARVTGSPIWPSAMAGSTTCSTCRH